MYNSDLVHIQEKSWKIAHGEDCHDDHQDDGHAVFSSSASLPPSSDGDVDLGVEEADCSKGN